MYVCRRDKYKNAFVFLMYRRSGDLKHISTHFLQITTVDRREMSLSEHDYFTVGVEYPLHCP